MRYIFVDFEMNPVNRKYTEVRKICRNEIIETGASMLDDNMNEISSFRIYVRPQYNDEIAPYCRELTGITMNRLFCADHFPSFSQIFGVVPERRRGFSDLCLERQRSSPAPGADESLWDRDDG